VTLRLKTKKRVKRGTRSYLTHKEKARRLVNSRLRHFNQYYNFEYKRVSIKNQKTKWGSCSNKANLNFNYRIMFLPEELIDYIVVHELCHLKELNHSKRFWALVAQTMPDYKKHKKHLGVIDLYSRNNGHGID
jgi:predicted metal-dependent hydrolase